MKFSEFNLDEKILKGIEDAGFVDCTEVQAESLKYTLEGRDILVQSQTGTGKTAAFMIPLYHLLLTNEKMKNKKVLILAPTRELVIQIEKEGKLLGKHLDLKIQSFYGGVGYNQQETAMKEGVDIYVGTPGRLIDFASSGKIKFNEFGILVIDEADRMFDMGFFPDIKRMMKRMAAPTERISMLFSATLSSKVKNLAWEYMNDPAEVTISGGQVTVDKIKQVLYHVGTNEKINLLLGILKTQNPQNALIFTNTKQDAVRVAARLAGNGYECSYIIGDLPQNKRSRIIENIKSGKLKYLVATDVAARGLHINDLDLVINYDIPEDFENYVHRIGRTARAGKAGMAVTFACEKFVYGLEAIESYIKMKIPVEWAGDEMFAEDQSKDEFIRNFMRESKQTRIVSEHDDKKTDRYGKERKGKERPAVAARPERKDTRKAPEKKEDNTVKTRRSTAEIKPKAAAGKSSYVKENRKKENIASAPKERPSKNLSLDKRMDYYKERYGEEFTVKREITASPEKKNNKKPAVKVHKKTPEKRSSLISKIKSIFKKK
ncbi:MAG TPA: DEAD/DEAH box helicase [Spirochaetota bacterium]|nr:DEAD/DEAH box helicase [Spirochaetota bacterium]HPS87319.1 DEAD/DEAH box helicase [Spirochaetota bacterium]